MDHRHVGVDLSALEPGLKVSVVMHGESLSDIDGVSCAVKSQDSDWADYPAVIGGDDDAFDEGTEEFMLNVPTGCRLSVGDLEVLGCQKAIEDAGYQWLELSKAVVGGEGREYLVAVTQLLLPQWSPATPNVESWGYRKDRVSCWKEAAIFAMARPAAGSPRVRREQNAAAGIA